MLFNFEIETQMARHIAANKPDKVGMVVVLFLLVFTILTVLLYVITVLSLLGAALFAFIFAMLGATPLLARRVYRRKTEATRLRELQAQQLTELRSKEQPSP